MSKEFTQRPFNKIKSDLQKNRKFIHVDLIRYNEDDDKLECEELMKNGYLQMAQINLELSEMFDSSPVTLHYKFDDINEYRDEKAKPIMLSVFGLTYPRATWDEINVFTDGSTKLWDRLRKIFGGRRTNIYREKGYFDPQVLAMEEGYLDGTFQSEKYFEDIREEVRKAFRFSDLADMHLPQPIYDSTVELLGRIMQTNAVGIHIRRSDSRPNEELYENICTPEYYRAAVNYIQERYPDATYYIFSNEPKWIKGWMKALIKSQITEEMTREQIVG